MPIAEDPLQSGLGSPGEAGMRGVDSLSVGGVSEQPPASRPTLTGGKYLGGQGSLPPQINAEIGSTQGKAAPLSPQEQAKIDADASRVVTRGMELLHSPSTRDSVVDALKNTTNLVQAVADQARVIIQRLDQATAREGVKLNDVSKLVGGKDLIDEISLIAKVSGAGDLDEDDKTLAYSVSVQDYLKEEIAAGRQNPKELNGAMRQLLMSLPKDELEKANKTGKVINKTAEKWKDKDPLMQGNTAGVGQTTTPQEPIPAEQTAPEVAGPGTQPPTI